MEINDNKSNSARPILCCSKCRKSSVHSLMVVIPSVTSKKRIKVNMKTGEMLSVLSLHVLGFRVCVPSPVVASRH